MSPCRVLLVDDDADFSFALSRALKSRGYVAEEAGSGEAALHAVRRRGFDAALVDLGLPDVSGHDLLPRLVTEDPDLAVIVLSGRDEAAPAVQALKLGAWHYLTKPASIDELVLALSHARERAGLRRRVEAAARDQQPSVVIGRSPAWTAAQEALRAAGQAPRTPVLVTGESGTGKEMSARLVHAWSERASGPFVAVNAGAFSPSLLESELFGHEAGAFTGARGTKRGLFELASGGTLFLDEIGELPLDLQPKLLRVLDGHPFRRVGGEREVEVDVRLVSATNRDLAAEVATGRFRLDLLHRLRVVEVSLPPLRERRDDIELLTVSFLGALARELRRAPVTVSPEALAALRAYHWPGNVRELRNVLERGVVLCRGPELTLRDLPRDITAAITPPPSTPVPTPLVPASTPILSLDDAVREHVLRAWAVAGQNLTHTARLLGISRMTLRRRLREYHVLTGNDDDAGE